MILSAFLTGSWRSRYSANAISTIFPAVGFLFLKKNNLSGEGSFPQATEAATAILNYGFDVLKLHRINANVEFPNEPSKLVLKRLGMKQIGEVEYEGVRAERWSLSTPKTLGIKIRLASENDAQSIGYC